MSGTRPRCHDLGCGRACPSGWRPAPRSGIALRISLLMVGVAVLTALIAGVVGTALVRKAATETARATLAGQADVVAAQLVRRPTPGAGSGCGKVPQILAGQGIAVVTGGPAGPGPDRDDDRARRAVDRGRGRARPSRCRARPTVDGVTMLVESRPVNGARWYSSRRWTSRPPPARNLQRPGAAGAGASGSVVAVAAGLVVRPARSPGRCGAPRRSPHAMAAGDRAARVEVAGPAEVAEVATAVNDLADAAARSEARSARLPDLGVPRTAHAAGRHRRAGRRAGRRASSRPAEVPEVALTIRAEASRMERMVSDLLDLARLGADTFAVDLQPVDLGGLVRGDGGGLAGPVPRRRGAVVQVFRPAEPGVVQTDPRRLRQVLDGLAENALRLLPSRPAAGAVSCPRPGRRAAAVLQVRDGGPGLAPRGLSGGVRPGCAQRAVPRAPAGRRRSRPRPGPRNSSSGSAAPSRPAPAPGGRRGHDHPAAVAHPGRQWAEHRPVRDRSQPSGPPPTGQRDDGRCPPISPTCCARARVFAIPLRTRFRGITVREGVLLDGPAGWSEFAPFRDYDDAACLPWLRAAIDSASRNWPDPVRDRVPVNCTVPVVDPDRCGGSGLGSGCRTAKVKVADAAIRPGRRRGHGWPPSARRSGRPAGSGSTPTPPGPSTRPSTPIGVLAEAAGGLEYVEQPCATVDELAQVRAAVDVPIAADESIRLAADPARVALAGAADVAVLKVAPLGGAFAALRVALTCGLPVVVSSALDTSVGLAAGSGAGRSAARAALRLRPGDRRRCSAGDVTTRQRDAGRTACLPVPLYAPAPTPDLLDRWAADRDDHPVLARPTAPGRRSAPVAAGREPGCSREPGTSARVAPVLHNERGEPVDRDGPSPGRRTDRERRHRRGSRSRLPQRPAVHGAGGRGRGRPVRGCTSGSTNAPPASSPSAWPGAAVGPPSLSPRRGRRWPTCTLRCSRPTTVGFRCWC